MTGSGVVDVEPLDSLTNLTTLWVRETSVSDVAPLTTLVNLDILRLNDNQITDLAPLIALTNLGDLEVRGNPIDCAAQADNLAAIRGNGVVLLSD